MSLKILTVKLINLYQKTISPDHGMVFIGTTRCRFYPSCSEYTKQVIIKRGLFKGFWAGAMRVIKCNPFFIGGVDNP